MRLADQQRNFERAVVVDLVIFLFFHVDLHGGDASCVSVSSRKTARLFKRCVLHVVDTATPSHLIQAPVVGCLPCLGPLSLFEDTSGYTEPTHSADANKRGIVVGLVETRRFGWTGGDETRSDRDSGRRRVGSGMPRSDRKVPIHLIPYTLKAIPLFLATPPSVTGSGDWMLYGGARQQDSLSLNPTTTHATVMSIHVCDVTRMRRPDEEYHVTFWYMGLL
ncbi:hypothetical protein N658DRAFT_147643 [Parathielavia hyrcaniae]|uniref:Secreted protein n=1 Tax=Parathielavia hyrcaniae TaxID=113614 RepID=A0AAN6PZB6_9PEZI|nr:hypothetical protein N658DRAFT_147643 [Parathielavia hyrcaniae]